PDAGRPIVEMDEREHYGEHRDRHGGPREPAVSEHHSERGGGERDGEHEEPAPYSVLHHCEREDRHEDQWGRDGEERRLRETAGAHGPYDRGRSGEREEQEP